MSPFEHLKRGKQSFTSTELFFMMLVPHYGVGQTSMGLAELAASLESLANKTALAMVGINSEVVALRAVAMQNRVALDLVLTVQGGTCALIGSECSTYCISPITQSKLPAQPTRLSKKELSFMIILLRMDFILGLKGFSENGELLCYAGSLWDYYGLSLLSCLLNAPQPHCLH